MADKIFTDGMIVKQPHANAPTFIIANLSFKVDDFKKFLTDNSKGGWVNVDIKVGLSGKYYGEVNTWTKDTGVEEVKQEIRETLKTKDPIDDFDKSVHEQVDEFTSPDENGNVIKLSDIPF